MIKKKKGYTLAELLIALGIVGVLAIISLSVISKNSPNRDRMMYMKTYMRISTIVETLVNDEAAYPNNDDQYNYSEFPFFNTNVVENSKYAKKWGIKGQISSKLCRLIADKYHATNSCDNTNNIPNFSTNLTPSFSTNDGVDFYIYTKKDTVGSLSNGRYSTAYKTVVYVDTFGRNSQDKGNNCIFDKDSCKEPDIHEFLIAADGKVYPIDAMGIYYIKNPKDKRKHKSKEYTTAELNKIASYTMNSNNLDKAYVRPLVNTAEGNVASLKDLGGDVGKNEGTKVIVSLAKAFTKTVVPESEVMPDLPASGITCNSVFCRYDCTNPDPSYRPYTSGGGCQDGTVAMQLDNRRGTHEQARDYCASIGLRLPTTPELSAARNYAKEMNMSTGNYWAEQNDKGDTRSGTRGYMRNCYMPNGNCGVHNPNDTQYYRCAQNS